MPEAPGHLSIGEVLSLLQAEFEDITISKIRFLESQGLIDPERTPSGYRKFYDADIARLRWVLRQQRDHFLPLKVIKAKLEQGAIDFADDRAAATNLFAQEADSTGATSASGSGAATPTGAAAATTVAEVEPSDAPTGSEPTAAEPTDAPATTPVGNGTEAPRDPGAWLAELQEAPRRAGSAPASRPVDPAAAGSGSGLTFGMAEVAEVTGLDRETIEALVTFGLVTPQRIGGEPTFDATAVAVVRVVARFLERGIEARHLRIFKNAADREAGFFEQLILPLLKQRNPRSRELAQEQLGGLVDDGEALHRALVHHALRAHLP